MTTKHANSSRISSCCHVFVRYHGGRRRQCGACESTWSIRKRKRGRKRRRASSKLANQYLDHFLPPLRKLARQRGCSREAMRRRFHTSMDALIRRAQWQPIPADGRLIAIADAMEAHIEHRVYTVYLILLKPVGSDRAIICPPLITEGREDRTWSAAFAKLDLTVCERICALVCDGHGGLRGVAIEHHWLLQRCHFHLIHALSNYVSKGRLARQKVLSWLIHSSVRVILATRDRVRLERSIAHLQGVTVLTGSHKLIRTIRGFLRYRSEYRTYLRHPHLNLPTTSNACESLVQCIRDVLYRIRGVKTERSFCRWVVAVLKQKQTIIANGHKPQN